MKYLYLTAAIFVVTPLSAAAAGLDVYLINIALFINNVLIPFLFGIAFLFFVINVVRFFVIQGSNQDGREKARNLITYSILAFVFLIIFWGMINLLTSSLGFTKIAAEGIPCADYMKGCDNNPNALVNGGKNPTAAGFGTGVGDFGPETGVGDNSLYSPTQNPTNQPGSRDPRQSPTFAAPVEDHDSLPTVNSDMINAAADAATTKETLSTIADDFIDKLPDIYDWRTSSVIEYAVAAINDPTATNQEKALAAARLANNNQLTNRDFTKYVAILNVEQNNNNKPEIDLTQVRRDAVQPTEYLEGQIEFTKQAMLPVIKEAHTKWYSFTGIGTSPEEAAKQDLDYIYNPTLSDKQKIAAFENVVLQGDLSESPEIAKLRIQLVNDINGERFFAGQVPLKTPDQPLNTKKP